MRIQDEVYDRLTGLGLIGQIWPVFKWDLSRPRILGLMVPLHVAALAVKESEGRITTALRRMEVVNYEEIPKVVDQTMREFYLAGLHRHAEKGELDVGPPARWKDRQGRLVDSTEPKMRSHHKKG